VKIFREHVKELYVSPVKSSGVKALQRFLEKTLEHSISPAKGCVGAFARLYVGQIPDLGLNV
jgi:hypothetical protein